MKKLIIISGGHNTGNRIIKQLDELLGEYLEMENIIISELGFKPIEGDLILFTSIQLEKIAAEFIDPNIPRIVGKRVIDHKNIEELIKLEEGTDVLFVNDCYESTYEAIEQLMNLGIDHINYHPYYPGCNNPYSNLKIVVTPGESQLVPYTPDKIIDIGTRILDIQSLHQLATQLDLKEYFKEGLVTDYIRDIIEILKITDRNRRKTYETQQILQTIVNSLEFGIAYVDVNGNILIINSKFEYIFGLKRKDILGKKLNDLLVDVPIELKHNNSINAQVEGKNIFIHIRQVDMSKRSENKIGYIAIVKYDYYNSKLESIHKNEYHKVAKKNLLNFDDYLTVNKNMKEMLRKAKKFAKSDSTILITGESGTGKEILAQAIHMNSNRSNEAFVPINIATLAPNLVESELFGYNEGTFTGAVKGGKPGIFEIANGGTVFIDEIGDMPIDVQAKLLRVLEGKKVRRVGSAYEFPVDVRIIAATNKNLLDLVEENKFRSDLFFRLNILPLETIPLRKRREDIEYLLIHFINVNLYDDPIKSLDEFFEQDTIEFLKSYNWPGNVRELINLTEYLTLIYEGEKIPISYLHSYMHNKNKDKKIILDANEMWVLAQFEKYTNIPLGRTKLKELAIMEGKEIGEGQIRKVLKELINKKLIEPQGNLGSSITELGKEVLEKYGF